MSLMLCLNVGRKWKKKWKKRKEREEKIKKFFFIIIYVRLNKKWELYKNIRKIN